MRRGQASMEFLTTYGWAFMIVLVMIGALTYFGVINADMLLPDKCNFEAGISCQDFQASGDSNQVRAMLLNGFGKTIKVVSLELDCQGMGTKYCEPCDGESACGLGNPIGDPTDLNPLWRPGESREVVIEIAGGSLTSVDKPKVQMDLTYKYPNEYFNKHITGEISTKVT